MKSLLCLVALLSVANSAAAQIPGAITKGADVVRRAQERQRQLEQLVISEEDERKLGIGISAKLRDRFGVLQSADAHTYVTTVGLLLASASERPKLTWTFVVLDTDGVNAFAAPGGFVHVTRGLLAMLRNEAELATVLGHEIAHVSKRHTITAIRQGRAVDLGTDQTFGNQPILDWVSDKAYSSIIENAFDRNDEIEADTYGLGLSQSLGYAPRALPDFLTRLDDRNKDQPRRNGLFASHPDTKARLDRIQQFKVNAAAIALVEPRYTSRVRYPALPTEAIDVVAEAQTPSTEANGAAPADSPAAASGAQAAPAAEPAPRRLFGVRVPKVPGIAPPKPAPSAVIDSGGPRGVGADRYAKGGDNPNPVKFALPTEKELASFRAGIV